MKLFGIPIAIRPMFVVVTLFLGASGTADPTGVGIWFGVVLVSIVVHELGHALVGRIWKLVPRIELHGMGGAAIFVNPEHVKLKTWQDIAISLAGPLAGFLLGALTLVAVHFAGPVKAFYLRLTLDYLLWVNFGWGLVNLLPVYPLDGGQVVAALLRKVDETGIVVRGLSAGVAAVGIGLAIYYGMWFAAALAAWFGLDNLRDMQTLRASKKDEPLWEELDRAVALYARHDLEAAREKLETILKTSRSEPLKAQALVQLTRVHVDAGNTAEARRTIEQLPGRFKNMLELQVEILVAENRQEEALEIARAVYEQQPDEGATLLIWTLALVGRYGEVADRLKTGPDLDEGLQQLFRHVAEKAHHGGHYTDSAAIEQQLFSRTGEARDAFNVACSLSRSGEIDQALSWLQKAVDAGDTNLDGWRNDPDLELLRDQAVFQSLQRQVERGQHNT